MICLNYLIKLLMSCSQVKPRCTRLLEKEDSLLMNCSNEFYLGSNCSFSCLDGYKLIGENVLSCIGENETKWNNILPYCRGFYFHYF